MGENDIYYAHHKVIVELTEYLKSGFEGADKPKDDESSQPNGSSPSVEDILTAGAASTIGTMFKEKDEKKK